ncbi:MAG: hypothetical protein ACLQUY_16265 [Ktedonobacterales bacterium]
MSSSLEGKASQILNESHALALLLLGGCALPGLGPAAPTQLASLTPTPTATPTLWMGAPHGIPTGWKVYYATRFTLALPAEWQVEEDETDNTSISPRPAYIFSFPQQDIPCCLYEWDGLTPAQVHDEFCTPTADDTLLTIGSLTMRFSVGYGAMGSGTSYDPFEYDWILISNHGTVYWFDFYVGPAPAQGYWAHLDRTIIKTFAPQYATWGCA